MGENGEDIQDHMFWNPVWTKEIESCFVDALALQAVERNYPQSRPSRQAIRVARESVIHEYAVPIPVAYCVKRTARLRQRYNCFKYLLQLTGFHYNIQTGEYVFPQALFEHVLQISNLVRAYRYRPEPQWSDMQIIFGPVYPFGPFQPPGIRDRGLGIVHALPAQPGQGRMDGGIVNWRDGNERVAADFWGYVANGQNEGGEVDDINALSSDMSDTE